MKKYKMASKIIFAFLAIIYLITSPSWSMYGLAIDTDEKNYPSQVRVLFFDLNKHRAQEVNYYSNINGLYLLNPQEKDPENPLIGISKTLTKDSEEHDIKIILSKNFNSNKYTLISKCPIYFSTQDSSFEFTQDNLEKNTIPHRFQGKVSLDRFGYIVKKRSPVGSAELETKLNDIKGNNLGSPGSKKKNAPVEGHTTTYRLIDATNPVIKTKTSLHEIFDKTANECKPHKESLGEQAFLLAILNYGYTKIYNTKIGKTNNGFDFVCFSDQEPNKKELLLIECKWTAEKDASHTHMNSSMNGDLIKKRIKATHEFAESPANQGEENETKVSFDLMKNFLNEPNTILSLFFYKIFDTPGRAFRGVAKPSLNILGNDEKIMLLSIINDKDQTLLKTFYSALSAENMQKDLSEEFNFLLYLKNEKDINFSDMFSLTKEKYSKAYAEFEQQSNNPPIMSNLPVISKSKPQNTAKIQNSPYRQVAPLSLRPSNSRTANLPGLKKKGSQIPTNRATEESDEDSTSSSSATPKKKTELSATSEEKKINPSKDDIGGSGSKTTTKVTPLAKKHIPSIITELSNKEPRVSSTSSSSVSRTANKQSTNSREKKEKNTDGVKRADTEEEKPSPYSPRPQNSNLKNEQRKKTIESD